ncbi:hypothetical protein G2W53_013684 [Senna tora]|uniref:Uncharacterized protein n=1 Tax=Senna tora TaxID=362788 RepID=A0A834WSA6_9FABA|nr:hypothetical protein G2W53_013684 [Senna tora]
MSKNLAEIFWCYFLVGFPWKFLSHRHTSTTHLASMLTNAYVQLWTPSSNSSSSMVTRKYHEDTPPKPRETELALDLEPFVEPAPPGQFSFTCPALCDPDCINTLT